jgi:hypothetical protein
MKKQNLKNIFLTISLLLSAYPLGSIAEPKDSIKNIPEVAELFKLLIPSKSKTAIKGFVNTGCKTEETKWFLFLAMQQSFTQSYTFGPKCQVEGQFTPKGNTFFDVNLKLKNFYSYKRVKMRLKIVLDTNMILTLTAKDAVLSGNKSIHFSANYKGKVQFEGTGVAFKNLGGKVLINKVGDRKVSISQPILIK